VDSISSESDHRVYIDELSLRGSEQGSFTRSLGDSMDTPVHSRLTGRGGSTELFARNFQSMPDNQLKPESKTEPNSHFMELESRLLSIEKMVRKLSSSCIQPAVHLIYDAYYYYYLAVTPKFQ
jgi:hypothetical protein